jgi:hypothetical protein
MPDAKQRSISRAAQESNVRFGALADMPAQNLKSDYWNQADIGSGSTPYYANQEKKVPVIKAGTLS